MSVSPELNNPGYHVSGRPVSLSAMRARTAIQLSNEMNMQLVGLAKRDNVSVSEAIRRTIAKGLTLTL